MIVETDEKGVYIKTDDDKLIFKSWNSLTECEKREIYKLKASQGYA